MIATVDTVGKCISEQVGWAIHSVLNWTVQFKSVLDATLHTWTFETTPVQRRKRIPWDIGHRLDKSWIHDEI